MDEFPRDIGFGWRGVAIVVAVVVLLAVIWLIVAVATLDIPVDS